jgi:hypothetical protein
VLQSEASLRLLMVGSCSAEISIKAKRILSASMAKSYSQENKCAKPNVHPMARREFIQ